MRIVAVAVLILAMTPDIPGQTPVSSASGTAAIAALMKSPAVRQALDLLRTTEAQTLDDQVRFCETPAPPFQESARAELLRREFVRLGLQNVRVDRAGNVLGDRPGTRPRPHIVLAAHLDTVFPPGTPVKVTRAGTTFSGPGIGDNCRGLAVLVAIVRAMRAASVGTAGTVTFMANVGEEGLGDLRGMREFFGVARGATRRNDVDGFVSIDGPGLFITNVAVRSRRYRVTFKGPGGHSYAAFGTASPIGALGRAVAKINEIRVQGQPRTTYNVGRIGGGTSVNAIPFEAWMEIDLRSSDPAALSSLDARIASAIDTGVLDENTRWGRPGSVTVSRELVGDRPGGALPDSSDIVRAASGAADALGVSIAMSEASTDANLPMSLGIPAIAIGGGGDGRDAHTLAESFDATDAWKGSQHAFLVTMALAQR